jgi:putative flippase GtrA
MKHTKLYNIYKKHEEITNYVIAGALTTLVSIVSYYLFRLIIPYYYINTTLSWIAAVSFAFIVNRKYVFKSKDTNIIEEFTKFVGSRLTTLLIEITLMFVLVTLLKVNDMIAKLMLQIIILVLNYILSKLYVFKKRN